MAWKDGLKGVLGALLGALGCVLLSWGGRRTGLFGKSAGHVFRRAVGHGGLPPVQRAEKPKVRLCRHGDLHAAGQRAESGGGSGGLSAGGGRLPDLAHPAYWAKAWIVHLPMSGLAMLAFWQRRGRLQVYIDPSLGPRYEAGKYAGGLMYNMCPMQLAAQAVPRQFYVGGKLEVDGARLRTVPALRKGRTFSMGEIAGVVLGRSTGSNVLYDKDHQVLAKFAWSMGNADLLFLYLLEHNVKFDNLPPELAVYGQPPTGS